MRATRIVLMGVLAGLVAVSAGDARMPVDPDAVRLATIVQRCDRLDRGAAEIAREVEGITDFERVRDTVLIADLTAFRAYVRGLREIAEEARAGGSGRRPSGTSRTALTAMRRMALRLRQTAANVEWEIAQERENSSDAWRRLVRDELDSLVAALLAGRDDLPPPPPPPPFPSDRPPAGFSRVSQAGLVKMPASLKGKARYVKIEAWGGDLKVKSVKFTIIEAVFDYLTFDYQTELRVNRDATPAKALLLEVERGRSADVSAIEIDWDPSGGRQVYARVSLVEEE